MKEKKITFVFILLVAGFQEVGLSQDVEKYIYKTLDDTLSLSIHVTVPDNYTEKKRWPLIVFYHGGGWRQGSYKQFLRHARYFSKLGFICALPEYRLASVHDSTPFESLEDAKSSMRYLKKHFKKFRIDTSKIVAAGGSAGGHLAAALDLVGGYNDPQDHLNINTKVNALVLFNPVLDNGPEGFGYDRVGDKYTSFSPYYQPVDNIAPTLIMLGTEDKLVSESKMETFCNKIKRSGGNCKLVLYDNQEHGFFNANPYYKLTLFEMHNFLSQIGLAKLKPQSHR